MQQYLRLGKFHLFGAPVYIHWFAIAFIVLILVIYWQSPTIAAIAILAFFSVILIHEIGHAAIAHRLGYRVFSLRVCLVHGVCEYEAPHYEWDQVKVAWGGILAQIMMSLLVFTLASLGAKQIAYFGPILFFLGYYNLFIIPFNLLPVWGLDGYYAWRILPLAYRHIKARSNLEKTFKRDRR